MKTGVCLYPDMMSEEEINEKILIVKNAGIDIIFTSAQLDDLGFANVRKDWNSFIKFFKKCKEFNLKTSVDVSDISIKKFNVNIFDDLSVIKELGIYSLRLDGGFSPDDIVQFTNNQNGIKIEINASMTDELDSLLSLIKEKGNINNLLACHNFFPREFTGLGWKRFDYYNKIIKKHGIKIGAFITSLNSKSKLCATSFGVPTIEKHRRMNLKYQIEDFKLRKIDYIIISEDIFSKEDVALLSKSAKEEFINIYIDDYNYDISNHIFTLREDQPENIRRTEQRIGIVPPNNNVDLPAYSLTIDNELNGRYSGEVQITLIDMSKQNYINKTGNICKDQMNLVSSKFLLNKKIKFIVN